MDTERLLITKVIHEADLGPAAEAGITRAWFTDPESARVWEMLTDHTATYGNVPTLERLRQDYPTYRLADTEESLAYLIDDMRKHRHYVIQEAGITDAALLLKNGEVNRVTERLQQALVELSKTSVVTSDINLATNGDDRLAHYQELSELDGQLRGIPSGFPFIDHALQGWEPGQLITFVGPPKTGKSTSMLLMAKAANEAGYEPLFIGFEMSNREQYERLDAIRAKISHARLRNGSLTPQEWKRLQRAIKAQANLPDFHMTQDSQSVMTLTGLRAKIEKINPECVFVDGVYLMQDEHGEPGRSAAALSNITAGLKIMAQQLGVPIIIATQALESKMKGKQISTFSIGYSSTFLQDSDALIGVEQTDDANVTNMKILAARNATAQEAFYEWCWEPVSFTQMEGSPFANDVIIDEEKARKYDW